MTKINCQSLRFAEKRTTLFENFIATKRFSSSVLLLFSAVWAFSQSYEWEKFEYASGHFSFEDTLICGTADSFEFTGIGLSQDCEMILHHSDSLAPTLRAGHYYQYHKGIPVLGRSIVVIERDEHIVHMHGNWERNLDVDTNMLLSSTQIVDTAIFYDTGSFYAWQDPAVEADLREDTGDSLSTHFPSPKLVIRTDTNSSIVAAYKVNMFRLVPDTVEVYYYLDATTGTRIAGGISAMKSTETGTVTPVHVSCSNSEDFTTYMKSSTKFILRDDTREIHTKKGGYTIWWSDPEVTDNDNSWACNKEPTAHWAAQLSWDFLDDQDDKPDRPIRVITKHVNGVNTPTLTDIHHRKGYYYIMIAKTRDDAEWKVDLDIVGHEFGHIYNHENTLLIENSDFLRDSKFQPYGIEESFCDVIGAMIQKEFSGTIDWQLGEGSYGAPGNRNLSTGGSNENRGSGEQSQKFEDQIFNDNNNLIEYHKLGGVHNKVFQLLVDGGTHNNKFVSSIGYDKAKLLFFKVSQITSANSSFVTIAQNYLWMATEEWKKCSPEYKSVLGAWHAVGITEAHGLPAIKDCITIEKNPGYDFFALKVGDIDPDCDIRFHGDGYLDNSDSAFSFIWNAPQGWHFNVTDDTLFVTGIDQPHLTDTLWMTAERGDSTYQTFLVVQIYDDSSANAVCIPEQLNKAESWSNVWELNSVRIYPNPSTNSFRINLVDLGYVGEVSFQITDLSGKTVANGLFTRRNDRCDISELREGSYVLRFNLDGFLLSRKLLIIR